MDALEKYRRDEVRRLICWIKDNRSGWLDILNALTEQNSAVTSELRDVIRSLRDNGFYQFIVLLLYTNNERIQNAINDALLSSVDTYWDEKLPDRIIDLLLDNLVAEKC